MRQSVDDSKTMSRMDDRGGGSPSGSEISVGIKPSQMWIPLAGGGQYNQAIVGWSYRFRMVNALCDIVVQQVKKRITGFKRIVHATGKG
jgi:hypothetical protein